MKLIIDSREKKIIDSIKGIAFEVQQLDLGDIIFENENNEIELIIERKTISDLYSSIIDGRLASQKARLSSCGIENQKICFLIENSNNFIFKNKSNLITSVLLGLSFKYNFKVFFSTDIENTCQIISILYSKYITDDLHFISSGFNVSLLSKSNFLSDKLFTNQLTLLKGVSIDIAESIKRVYSNFVELVNSYESLESEKERCEMLIGVKINEKRKIGKVLSKKIYEQLYEK